MNQKDFYTEIFINANPEIVWQTFLSKDGFFKSFFGTEIQTNFSIGDKIEFVSVNGEERIVHIYGEILEYEQYKILAYTDHPGPIYYDNHAELKSRVKITLEPIGQVTKLTLTNDQFSDDTLKKEASQWWLILSNFKTFLETGTLMKLK